MRRAEALIAAGDGVLTSTRLTLVVVPVIYTYLDALERRLRHRSRSSPRAAV